MASGSPKCSSGRKPRLAFWLLIVIALALTGPASAAEWQIEAGAVVLPATDASSTFVPVVFRQAYAEPPVVVVLASSDDVAPVSVRIRNVTATGFEMVQVEPGGEDGPHGTVEVHYLAVEPGEHIFADGTKIEAGFVNTMAVQHGPEVVGGESWEGITFGTSFPSTPVLLAALQTTANETAAIPGAPSEAWLVVSVDAVTENGAAVALERCESAAGEVTVPETIGWVAIEAGVVTTLEANDESPVALETLLTERYFKGWDHGCRRVDFSGAYGQPPLVVGHKDTHNGDDGGWLRRCAVDAGGIELAIDEDRFEDSERLHNKEIAGLLALEKAFDAVVEPPPVARLETASVRTGEEGGSATLEVVLDRAATGTILVDYATTDGTAVAGADYAAAAETLTILAGQVGGTITVPILGDSFLEGAETFGLALTGVTGGLLGSPIAAEVLIADDDTAAVPGWRIEADSLELSATDGSSIFVETLFRQAYAQPPVVVVLSSSVDGDPVAVRVRSVTAAGFELVQVEPGGEDGPHGPVEVHYLAVEPGEHTLGDGTKIEAGFVDTAAVQKGPGVLGDESWESFAFGTAFASPPVLLVDLQSTVNETAVIPGAPSDPWLTVALQIVTESGAEVALERSQSAPGEVTGPESIGWVAIEAGVVTTVTANNGSAVGLEALLTADFIKGWDHGCRRADFVGSYGQPPLVVAHQNTHGGDDGGWLRRCAVDAGGVELAMDEDRFADAERLHNTEIAGLVALEESFDAVVTGSPPVLPAVSFPLPSVVVGEEDGAAALAVKLSAGSAFDVSVDYAFIDGSATGGQDYTSVGNTLVIPAGQTSGFLTVPILSDTEEEGNEIFSVSLSNPQGAALGTPAVATVTITDDDLDMPAVQFISAGWTFGEANRTITLQVEMSAVSQNDVTVGWFTSDGTAFAGEDFEAGSGVITIPAGWMIATLTLNLFDDPLAEETESFTVNLSEPVGVVMGPTPSMDIAITDDETITSYLSFDTSIIVVNEDEGPVELIVRLDPPAGDEVTVQLVAAGGTAVLGADYEPADETLVFAPGETSKTVALQITDDTTYENAESIEIALSSPTGPAGLGSPSTATVEISANDEPPEVFLQVGLEGDADFSASESIGVLVVPVRLSEPSGIVATVDFDTFDDQAVAGVDYLWIPTTLVFGPGQTEKLVTIQIFSDGVLEPPEDFDIELSNPAGCTFGPSGDDEGRVVISDSQEIAFADASVSVPEGADSVELTVVLSEPSDWGVEFDWRTTSRAATGDVDYQELSESAQIDRFETETTISIPLIEDNLAEADESFAVSIFFSEFAIAEPDEVIVTIIDNDDEAIQFDGTRFEAGEDQDSATVTVVLNEAQDHDVSVDWVAVDGTAHFGDDYATSAATVTVPAGQTSANFQVYLVDDGDAEADETVELTLSGAAGIALGQPSAATLKILDDDRLPVVSFTSGAYSVLETADTVELTVFLNEPSDEQVVIWVETADETASSGSDYTEVSEALTIPAGESTATVSVSLQADGQTEGDETFSVSLSAPDGAVIGAPASATVTIIDDASLPRVSFATAAVTLEEWEGIAVFDVVLDRVPAYEVTVRVMTADGEAFAGTDYWAVDRVLTFAPGVTSQVAYVNIFDDASYEPDESLTISLSEVTNGFLEEPTTASIAILANDWPPFVSLAGGGSYTAQYTAFEQNEQIVIPVRLSDPSGFEARVSFATSEVTATEGVDYQPVSGTLVFAPGQIEHLIVIPIGSDDGLDNGETFRITLSNPIACNLDYLLPDDGIVTIRDDAWAMFTEAEVASLEDVGAVTLTITLSAPLDQEAYVSYSTNNGTAMAGEDYTAVSNTLYFAPGVTSQNFSVAITADSELEDDETFSVSLASPSGVPLGSPSIVDVTILDDELPEVAVSQATFSVGESSGLAEIAVTLSYAPVADVSIDWATTDGSATDGIDYAGDTDTLVIPAGQSGGAISIPVLHDGFIEGDETFTLTLSNPQEAVLRNADTTEVTIVDDDQVGAQLTPTSLQTTENGPPTAFDIVLTSEPTADVTIDVASSDLTEGTVSPASVVFDPAGWDTPQTIIVAPVDDGVIDGHVQYVIETQPATSSDLDYAGLDASDVSVTNFDDELRALISEPIDGRIYGDGEVLPMNASASIVPDGYQTWFAVLRDDGVSEPMDLVHLAAGLIDGFTASDADPAYRVRVVVATAGSMPSDAELRGRDLPCILIAPDLECDSTEAALTLAESWQPTNFETVYELPEGVFLRWAGPELLYFERSADGGETWVDIGRSTTEHYFEDESVLEGTTYHYRGHDHPDDPWVYLGSTAITPGLPVAIPVWSAPRILPQLDDLTWHCPPGATPMLCEGTLHLRLVGEPGTGSLEGATIRVFLNEETFELSDGEGEQIHTEFVIENDYLQDFTGYDLPGCVVRKPTPDLEVVLPPGEEEIAVDLDGVVYGANGLRFEVEMPSGDISERALLVALLDQPVQTSATVGYPPFLPVLFGDVMTDDEPLIWGIGPASRPSPDCKDGDSWYSFDHWPDYVTSLFLDRITFAGEDDVLITTDGSGGWSRSYGPLADGAFNLAIEPPGGELPQYGSLGRAIEQPGGGFSTDEYAPQLESFWLGPDADITIDSTIIDLEPELAYADDTVLIDSTDEIANATIRFRLTDADQDLDMSTVRVFNCSLETCVPGQPGATPYYGFYSYFQIYPEGDLGWFVAELPFTTAGDGINSLTFCASDAAGNELGTPPTDPCITRAVTRLSPLVYAVVTEPATIPHTAPPGAVVALDGSDSMMPSGGVALWTTGLESAYLGNPWQQLSATAPTSDVADLVTTTLMPYSDSNGFRARLVVAASPADLPAELWPEDGSPPCVRADGEGRCDSADVLFDVACSVDHENAQVVMDEPTGPLNIGPGETIHLAAHVAIPSLEPFAYRWLVYRDTGGGQDWLVTTIGADDEGEGFSIDNNDMLITPAGQGLGPGTYSIYAEARYPASGCAGPTWYRGNSDGISLTVGHTLDGVAPGRVIEGGTFRVYSRSWIEGEDGYVFIDDDTGDAVDPIVYFGTVQPGGYLEITPGPGELPAIGAAWFVSVGDDLEGTGRSGWFGALGVEPAGDATTPLPVANEEDVSCGGAGTECSHAILPGQTWQGEWSEPGDTDYFSFIAGAGTGVSITLERVDLTLPPQHPDAPAPEILLVRPDDIVFAASAPLGLDDTATSLVATLTMDGRYAVAVRTPKGSGDYLVTLTQTAEGGAGSPSFGFTNARTHLTTEAHDEARLRVPLLDAFGNSLALASVSFEQGADCGVGEFCGTGTNIATRTSLDGHAVAIVAPETGDDPLWRPMALLGQMAKSRATREGVAKRAAEARIAEPVLGVLETSGNAVTSSDLPDLTTAHAITAAARQRAERESPSFLKDGPLCGSHDATCPSTFEPVFRAVKLELNPDEELIDIELRVLDGGAPTESLDGFEVMTDVSLTLEAEARILLPGGGEDLRPITGPISMMVSEGAGGAISNGAATCSRLDVTPGGFTFKTGRSAALNRVYTEPDGSPCCWLPTEVLAATVVIEAEVDDGQGGTLVVTKESTKTVESVPRPADPCELRSLQTGTPQLATYSAYPAISVGRVYATDACGNVVYGLGQDDSLYHDQLGDEVRITSPLQPPGEGVWATAFTNTSQWCFDVFLHGDSGEFPANPPIPDGVHTINFEVASQSSQCSAGGVINGSYTVQTTVGTPQVALWWDWIWDAENSPRGPDPEDTFISPGSALRDRSGAVAVWRVPASDDPTVDHLFEGPYTNVPVKLYVASISVPFDEDGGLRSTYLEPVEGVELCTGVVEKQTDSGGSLDFNSPVRTTCDTTWTTISDEVFASSDPAQTGHAPDTWVAVGLGAGITKGPEQPGRYLLVAEPQDEAFRRGEAWKVRSSLVPDEFVGFEVGGGVYLDELYRPITLPIVVSPYPSLAVAKSESSTDIELDRRVITVELRAWSTAPTINATLEMHWEGEVTIASKSIDLQLDHLESNGKSAIYRRRIGIRRPEAADFSEQELDPGLAVISFILEPGRGILKTILDGDLDPAVQQDVLFPLIEFIDEFPTYSRITDEDSDEYDSDLIDSDNFFLRVELDHLGLDIFYRILPKLVKPESVEFVFYQEETDQPSGEPLEGEQDSQGLFMAGDDLHVRWDGAGEPLIPTKPQDVGYYRVRIAVKYPGIDEPIVTPIDDADVSLDGWQMPENGMAFHDLVWKHRPILNVVAGESGVPAKVDRFLLGCAAAPEEPSVVRYWEDGNDQPVDLPPGEFPIDPDAVDSHFWDLFHDGDVIQKNFNQFTSEQMLAMTTTDSGAALYHAANREETDEVLFLQFFMFENFSTQMYAENIPYPPGFPYVQHEGDMEYFQIAIRLANDASPSERSGWLKPFGVTASQHYYAQTLLWDENDGGQSATQDQDHVEHMGGRPMIYVAEGAHATYLMESDSFSVPWPFVGEEKPCLGTQAQYETSSTTFDRTSPSRTVPAYSLIPLDSEEGDLVSQYSGRWGFLVNGDPSSNSNGPAGPPSRAARKCDDEPVVLLSEPCRLHNLSRKISQMTELCIVDCESQAMNPDEACGP